MVPRGPGPVSTGWDPQQFVPNVAWETDGGVGEAQDGGKCGSRMVRTAGPRARGRMGT
jgi:hypothetical protein